MGMVLLAIHPSTPLCSHEVAQPLLCMCNATRECQSVDFEQSTCSTWHAKSCSC